MRGLGILLLLEVMGTLEDEGWDMGPGGLKVNSKLRHQGKLGRRVVSGVSQFREAEEAEGQE